MICWRRSGSCRLKPGQEKGARWRPLRPARLHDGSRDRRGIQLMESGLPDGIDPVAPMRSSLLASAALLAARGLLLCGRGLLRGGLLLRRRPCGRPSSVRRPSCACRAFFLRPAFLRPSRPPSSAPALRPAFFFGSGLLAAARPHRQRLRALALRWLGFLRYSPVGTPSRVVGCSRAVEPRPGRRSCVGCRLPRAPMPHMPGSATNQPGAHQRHRIRRICDPASDVDARSTLLHLDWSAVNGPSFR